MHKETNELMNELYPIRLALVDIDPNQLRPDPRLAFGLMRKEERFMRRLIKHYPSEMLHDLCNISGLDSRFPGVFVAHYLKDTVTPNYLKTSASLAISKRFAEFIPMFDVTWGVGISYGPVIDGEREISRGSEKVLEVVTNELLDEFQEDEDSVEARKLVEEIDFQLRNQIMREALILIEDPSGLTSINEELKLLRGEPNRIDDSPLIQKLDTRWVLRGAEHSQRLYKMLLNLLTST
jgi:hypothetical protein